MAVMMMVNILFIDPPLNDFIVRNNFLL